MHNFSLSLKFIQYNKENSVSLIKNKKKVSGARLRESLHAHTLAFTVDKIKVEFSPKILSVLHKIIY